MQIFFATPLLVALAIILPRWRNRTTKLSAALRQCDWIGISLFMASSVFILVFITIGGAIQPWSSPMVVSCLSIGVICMTVLILHQRYVAKNPAFPKEIFKRPITNVGFGGSMGCGMLLSMVFYNLVIFWEGVRHQSTLRVGLMLLAVTATYAVAAATVGLVIKYCGRIRWATITGSICVTTGLGLMWFMDEKTPVPPLILISMLAAAGCGTFLPAMISTVLASTTKPWHSHAIAQRTLMYTAGQCMGVSLGLAIFTQAFASRHVKLGRQDGGHDLIVTPQSLLRVLKDLEPGSKTIGLIVDALRHVWVAACVTAIVLGCVACAFKCPDLPKDEEHDAERPVEPQGSEDQEMPVRNAGGPGSS